MSEPKLYGIKDPSGALLFTSLATSRIRAWDNAYNEKLWLMFQNTKNPIKAAYARGYRCVRVVIREWRGD